MSKLTREQARELIVVREPQEVAWTSKDGTLRDDDGDPIDERCTVPHTWALGPFGSWPATMEDVEKDLAAHDVWHYGESMRLGPVVVYKQGWGYSAKERAR